MIPDSLPVAITITHEPDAGWPERLRAILRICTRCIVVDNSVTPASRERVRTVVSGMAGVDLITNLDNPGLGRGLNQGCAHWHAIGHSWVIAFDQDSTPHPGLANALLNTAASCTQPVAVVGSNWRDISQPGHVSRHLYSAKPFGFRFHRLVADRDLRAVLCVITSGSLFSLKAWHELGGFDETLFLDLVDTDFCLRARRAGWSIAVSAMAYLNHRRGNKQPKRFLGRICYPSFVPPARLRILARSRLQLFRRHGCRERAWLAYELVFAAKLLADILFLEDQKAAKLAACICGTWEGIFQRES